MKSSRCDCGVRVFFHNTKCLACGNELAVCHGCCEFIAYPATNPEFKCSDCGDELVPCINRTLCGCNGAATKGGTGLCSWCEFTTVVPDLTIADNTAHWMILEQAKRKLINQLVSLRLPPFNDAVATHPLEFQFLSDFIDPEGVEQRVYTGHANGVITINIKEADSAFREKTRIELNEPQRTLIGHLRHEYGHYLDLELPVTAREGYTNLFGDASIDYVTAKDRYYEQGPPADWRMNFVSAYATMHPWEDFAETVNLYLDMQAIATTAVDSGWIWSDRELTSISIHELVDETLRISVAVSEFNSDLGLAPLLPENIQAAVLEKLAFVHSLPSHFQQATKAA
jgi:hypothetical protein